MKPGIKKRVRLLIISNQQKGKNKQSGIALLVLVIIIALTLSAYYFSSISVVDIKIDNIEKTRVALKQAKRALINYAVMHADGNGSGVAGEYGYLPCPDSVSNVIPEGDQDGTCGDTFKNFLGYLPWKALDLPPLKDGSGSCLWYAVSGNYKGENSSGLINEDTDGFFQVVDSTVTVIEDRIVALIFSPGTALSGQVRDIDTVTHCGENYGNQIAYLEGNGVIDNSNVPDVVDSPDQFIHATLTSDAEATPYNDYFVTITREEIWKAIMRRSDLNNSLSEVTEELANCLENYVNAIENPNKRFPWPAKMDLDGDYRVMSDYVDVLNATSGYAGRFPFYLYKSNSQLALPANNIIDMGNCANFAAGTELRIILNNWKDHFFYALSKDYALPDVSHTGCSSDCVSIEDPVDVFTNYAAIVFYSGSPYTGIGQSRNIGDKSDVLNYLENDNAGLFPDVGGDGVYTTTNPDPLISNDIMFCLTDDATPTVVAC